VITWHLSKHCTFFEREVARVRKSVSDAKEELEKVTEQSISRVAHASKWTRIPFCLLYSSKISSSLDLLLYVVKPRSAVIPLVY
jgi:hypothetical protein